MNKIFEENGYKLNIKPMVNGGLFDDGYYYEFTKETYKNTDNINYTMIKKVTLAHRTKETSDSHVIVRSYWFYDTDESGIKRDENSIVLNCDEIKALYEMFDELGIFEKES